MTAVNPLLLNAEEEHHAFLLEKGNLGPSRKTPEFNYSQTFDSQGYLAEVLETLCRCGSISKSLTGIFHVEQSRDGKTTRKTALDLRSVQIPHFAPTRKTTNQQYTPRCPECLPAVFD